MIRGGFLSDAERQALTAMARDGLAEHRIARRANAIVLLDKGWSCVRVAGALLLDDDTVRGWAHAYETGGLDALSRFGHEGSSCRLTLEQQAALQNLITMRLPRSTRTIGAWLEKNHGLNYSRSGLIALLHRLGFDYRKPHKMPRGLNDVRQQAFIASYEKLLNTMAADEAVVFVDAVHPTHQVRAAGCWAPKNTAIAVEQTTGRQSLNIHGAINLETGQTQMLEVAKVNAMSLIALLKAIEAAHPAKKRVHVYLDNASYHHANIVRDWLTEQHRKSVLHFIPPYCPHLDPIEQCWALMHQHTTHNRDYRTFRQFKRAIVKFLKQTIPKNWNRFCDRITDNFRVILGNSIDHAIGLSTRDHDGHYRKT